MGALLIRDGGVAGLIGLPISAYVIDHHWPHALRINPKFTVVMPLLHLPTSNLC